MEVQFQGVADRRDLLSAVRTHSRLQRWGMVALFAAGAAGVVASNHWSADGIGPWAAVPLAVLLALTVIVARAPASVASRHASMPRNQVLRVMRADASGLTIRSSLEKGQTGWEAFTRFTTVRSAVILHEGEGATRIIPRSFFASEGDWATFRALVEQHIGTGGGRQPRASAAPMGGGGPPVEAAEKAVEPDDDAIPTPGRPGDSLPFSVLGGPVSHGPEPGGGQD